MEQHHKNSHGWGEGYGRMGLVPAPLEYGEDYMYDAEWHLNYEQAVEEMQEWLDSIIGPDDMRKGQEA